MLIKLKSGPKPSDFSLTDANGKPLLVTAVSIYADARTGGVFKGSIELELDLVSVESEGDVEAKFTCIVPGTEEQKQVASITFTDGSTWSAGEASQPKEGTLLEPFATAVRKIKEAQEINETVQKENFMQLSINWHRCETIDDCLHEALTVLGD